MGAFSKPPSVMFVLFAACVSPSSSGPPDSDTQAHDAKAMLDSAGSGSGCRNNVTSGNGDGFHNAGMDCMDGCHNHGFTLAGTVYTSATGTTAASGPTITVLDAAGKTVDMVVQTNGNFYTNTTVTYPVTVYASDCPTVQMMTTPIAKTADTGCNQSGCHASNSAQGRIHLP